MKKINRLTVKEIDKFKPSVKGPIQKCDGENLYLVVHPSGTKTFRMMWRRKGEQTKQYTIGTYPKVGLKEAREKRDEINAMICKGIDPRKLEQEASEEQQRTEEIKARTFRVVALEWYEKRTQPLEPKYRRQLMLRLERYVFPLIGDIPIVDVTFSDLVNVVQTMENRHIVDTTQRVSQLINRIFTYAHVRRFVNTNEATDITKIASLPNTHTHRPAIVDPEKIGILLRNIDAYNGSVSVSYALKIIPYIFLRSRELRLAEWSELDFAKRVWTVPAAHMKRRIEHVVPLSTQVVNYLMELKKFNISDNLLFPSTHSKTQPISDMALLSGVHRMGYSRDEMCVHGFRSMASTRLNEMGFRPDVIEAQLAHTQGKAVRAAYNRAQYLEERTEMMQKWADYLDELREQAPA